MIAQEVRTPACELCFGEGKKKLYLNIFFDPDEIWVDIQHFPKTAFFCAAADGETLITYPNEKKKMFVNIKWLINKWGGPTDVVECLKIREELTLKEMPRLKEKYKVN